MQSTFNLIKSPPLSRKILPQGEENNNAHHNEMEKAVFNFAETMVHNKFFQAVALAVVFDTLMGLFRAIKEKEFNSCFGINGAIRKVAMVICILFLGLADKIIGLNLIGFIPKELWPLIGILTPAFIGLMEFFAILFIVYEIVSILKNMTLAGLPVKGLWMKVKNFCHSTQQSYRMMTKGGKIMDEKGYNQVEDEVLHPEEEQGEDEKC